ESVAVANGIPVSHAGAAERIHADANFALCDCLQIDDRGKIAHIGIEVLLGMYGGGASGTIKRYSRHPAQAVGNEGVGLAFYPFRCSAARQCSAACGRGKSPA